MYVVICSKDAKIVEDFKTKPCPDQFIPLSAYIQCRLNRKINSIWHVATTPLPNFRVFIVLEVRIDGPSTNDILVFNDQLDHLMVSEITSSVFGDDLDKILAHITNNGHTHDMDFASLTLPKAVCIDIGYLQILYKLFSISDYEICGAEYGADNGTMTGGIYLHFMEDCGDVKTIARDANKFMKDAFKGALLDTISSLANQESPKDIVLH